MTHTAAACESGISHAGHLNACCSQKSVDVQLVLDLKSCEVVVGMYNAGNVVDIALLGRCTQPSMTVRPVSRPPRRMVQYWQGLALR